MVKCKQKCIQFGSLAGYETLEMTIVNGAANRTHTKKSLAL